MENIVEILMRRDGISRNEAENLVEQCQQELASMLEQGSLYSLHDYEETVADWLGLEPDYLVELLWGM